MDNASATLMPRNPGKPVEPEPSRESTDLHLLQRFLAERDEEAFASLVRRHGGIVWSVCLRVLQQEQDAEDAFQAVFLILARKAASIRKGEAVDSWLYGVAYRTAMKTRHSAARRHTFEQQATGPTPEPAPCGQAAYRELQRLLDEEVQRLAAKYRAPFVLCCLEGRSKTEAAQELGWKEGTVSSRLAQARKLLQTRLTRRGVTLTAVLTALALAPHTAAAAPPALVHATIQAVLGPLAGKAAALLSPSVVALADGLMRSMAAAKLKVGALLLLGLTTLAAGAGLIVLHLGAAPQDTVLTRSSAVRFARFSPAGDRLVSGGDARTLTLWRRPAELDLPSLRDPERTWPAHDDYVSCALFLEKGKVLATGSWDGTIRLWDVSTGESLGMLDGHQAGIRSLAVVHDGKTLLSASEDATVRRWDLATLEETATLQGNQQVVYALAVSPDGKILATAGGNHRKAEPGELILWDAETLEPCQTIAGVDPAWGIAFSPDGTLLAVGFVKGVVQVYHAASGEVRASLDAPFVRPVAFSPDGKFLAAGHGRYPSGTEPGRGGVYLWDTATWKTRADYPGHEHVVFTVDFSPDGHTLASASQDGTIKLWPVPGAAEFRPIQVAENPRAVTDPEQGKPAGMAEPFVEPAAPTGQRLAIDFRTKLDDLPAVALIGPEAQTQVQTDAEGLRITLPAGRNDCRNVGVELPLRLRGDFAIDVGFELLAIGANIPDPAAGVQMRLTLEGSSTIFALARFRNRYSPQRAAPFQVVGHNGDTFAAYRIGILPNGNEHPQGVDVRASEPRGRLKLLRKGAQLHSLVSDGGSPYQRIRSEEVGTGDVDALRLVGFSGWGPVAVDVRFTDVVIEAEQLPEGVPGRFVWSKAGLALALGLGLLLTLTLGAWFFGRHRRPVAEASVRR